MDLMKIEKQIPDTQDIIIEWKGVPIYKDEDKKTGALTITVYGPSSEQAVAYQAKLQRKALNKVNKGNRKFKTTPEEIEEGRVERLVALTANVENLEYNKQDITVENIGDIYRNPKLSWLSDQVEDRLGSIDDFLE